MGTQEKSLRQYHKYFDKSEVATKDKTEIFSFILVILQQLGYVSAYRNFLISRKTHMLIGD